MTTPKFSVPTVERTITRTGIVIGGAHWQRPAPQGLHADLIQAALLRRPARNGWGGRALAIAIGVALAAVLFVGLSK